ncbi:hypothetical protein OESDEN_04237 [Oesophagostomum dentatum]|uniref:Peptidase S9 prolyl oligopeptidase catalytic domain-containing protein n=1 Tax=Oesophagostomum dentatum TaxID=61180 RepID=A0A0B1TEW5_OESDE|nr:hypothetical protein OESDEN_04237 [Oesophagostomum dentatum]
MHGMKDEMVPYENSIALSKRLRSPNVELTLVPEGTHYLSVDQLTAQKLDAFLKLVLHLKRSTETRSASKM